MTTEASPGKKISIWVLRVLLALLIYLQRERVNLR
jgi:hypothetical protein